MMRLLGIEVPARNLCELAERLNGWELADHVLLVEKLDFYRPDRHSRGPAYEVLLRLPEEHKMWQAEVRRWERSKHAGQF